MDFQKTPIDQLPDYGVYKWWPESGDSWIHPFDVGIVRQLIPSDRVFSRQAFSDKYVVVNYGDISFRVRPTIWYQVEYEGLDVGDYVEVKSRMGKRTPFIGRIRDLKWDHHNQYISYYLYRTNHTQVRGYREHELSLVTCLGPNRSPNPKKLVGLPELHRSGSK